MPRGLRDTGAYALGYRAQAAAYLLLVTDRYPNADPDALLASREPPARAPGAARGRRRRPAPLAPDRVLPAAARDPAPRLARTCGGLAVLARVRCSGSCRSSAAARRRRSTASSRAYIRYGSTSRRSSPLAANPFPGFTGRAGQLSARPRAAGAGRQNRWKTGFRLFLAFPALSVERRARRASLSWRPSSPGSRRSSAAGRPRACATSARTRSATAPRLNALPLPGHRRYPHASPLEGAEPAEAPADSRRPSSGVASATAARGGAGRLLRRSAGASRRGCSGRPRCRRRCACRIWTRSDYFSQTSSTTRRRTSASAAIDSGSAACRRARRLRRCTRSAAAAFVARVGGRADGHRDAARDARLRAALAGRAAVRRRSALWWERRHDLIHEGYLDGVCGGWLALGGQFVFLCVALAIVMGLARLRRQLVVAARRAGVRGRWRCFRVRLAVPRRRRTGSTIRRSQAAVARARAAGARRHDPGASSRTSTATRRCRTPRRSGFGPSRRVVLWDTLLDGRSPRARSVVIAHELGHVERDHILKSIGWFALFAFPAPT